MRETKFTINAVMLVAVIFTIIGLFVVIKLPAWANNFAFNEFMRIEGTDISICYSNLRENGLYTGDQVTGTLRLKGDFISNWGVAVVGDRIYLNELKTSELGLYFPKLVTVDINSFEKTELAEDKILRGKCASGELVVIENYVFPFNYPGTSGLVTLYALSSDRIVPRSSASRVIYLDPVTAEEVYSVYVEDVNSEDFESLYMERTLGEVRK